LIAKDGEIFCEKIFISCDNEHSNYLNLILKYSIKNDKRLELPGMTHNIKHVDTIVEISNKFDKDPI